MNQIFSASRFFKYAFNQVYSCKKLFWLSVSGLFGALFLLFLASMADARHWSIRDWTNVFFITFAIGAVPYIGSSFPYLRRKEKSISSLLLPASVFEKFAYELVSRVLAYCILFPVIFYLAAYIATPIADYWNERLSLLPFEFDAMFHYMEKNEFFLPLFLSLFFLGASLFFAGSVAFRRYPLVKVIVFVGVIVFSVIGYFYLLLEQLDLHRGIGYVAEHIIGKNDDEAILKLYWFLGSSVIVALVYAFFKFKEKEVS